MKSHSILVIGIILFGIISGCKSKPDNVNNREIDSILTKSLLDAPVNIFLFDLAKNGLDKSFIDGSDSSSVYKNTYGTIYKYKNYRVLIVNQNEFAGEIVKIFSDTNIYGISVSVDTLDQLYSDEGMGVWFYGLKDNYAFFDLGTGPERGLEVVDLNLRKSIFSTSCISPISINSSYIISYYSQSSEEATKANHPEYDEVKNAGLLPIIEEKFSYNLKSKEIKTLGNKRPGNLQ
jgi:hypothetical protein